MRARRGPSFLLARGGLRAPVGPPLLGPSPVLRAFACARGAFAVCGPVRSSRLPAGRPALFAPPRLSPGFPIGGAGRPPRRVGPSLWRSAWCAAGPCGGCRWLVLPPPPVFRLGARWRLGSGGSPPWGLVWCFFRLVLWRVLRRPGRVGASGPARGDLSRLSAPLSRLGGGVLPSAAPSGRPPSHTAPLPYRTRD